MNCTYIRQAISARLDHVTDFAGLVVVWLLSRPATHAVQLT